MSLRVSVVPVSVPLFTDMSHLWNNAHNSTVFFLFGCVQVNPIERDTDGKNTINGHRNGQRDEREEERNQLLEG